MNFGWIAVMVDDGSGRKFCGESLWKKKGGRKCMNYWVLFCEEVVVVLFEN